MSSYFEKYPDRRQPPAVAPSPSTSSPAGDRLPAPAQTSTDQPKTSPTTRTRTTRPIVIAPKTTASTGTAAHGSRLIGGKGVGGTMSSQGGPTSRPSRPVRSPSRKESSSSSKKDEIISRKSRSRSRSTSPELPPSAYSHKPALSPPEAELASSELASFSLGEAPMLAAIRPASAFNPTFDLDFSAIGDGFAQPPSPRPPSTSSKKRSVKPPVTPPRRSSSLDLFGSPTMSEGGPSPSAIPPRRRPGSVSSNRSFGSDRPGSTYTVDVFQSSNVKPGARPASAMSVRSEMSQQYRSSSATRPKTADAASIRSVGSNTSLRSVNGKPISNAFPSRPSPSRSPGDRSLRTFSSASSLAGDDLREQDEDDDAEEVLDSPDVGRGGNFESDELSSLMRQMEDNGSRKRPAPKRTHSALQPQTTSALLVASPPASPQPNQTIGGLKPLSLSVKAREAQARKTPSSPSSRRMSQDSTASVGSATAGPSPRRLPKRLSSVGIVPVIHSGAEAPMMDRDATLRADERQARFGVGLGVSSSALQQMTDEGMAQDPLARGIPSAESIEDIMRRANESPVVSRIGFGRSATVQGLVSSGHIDSERSLHSLASSQGSELPESPIANRVAARSPQPTLTASPAMATPSPVVPEPRSPLAEDAIPQSSPYQMAQPVAEPHRAKTIEEIIRDHAGPSYLVKKTSSPGQTPAQAVAATARSQQAVPSSSEDSEADSLGEEIKSSVWEAKQDDRFANRRTSTGGHSSTSGGAAVAASMARSASQNTATTATTATLTGIERPRTPNLRQGSGSSVTEAEPATIERELAVLLKSPRLTRILSLSSGPNAGLNVSLADVGAAHGHPVIVFLGLGCVRYLIALYDEVAAAFGLRLICIDRWGLGKTGDVPDEKRGFAEWATVVEEVVEQLGLSSYSLLAHSAGGPYSLASALRTPAHVHGSIHLLAPWVSTSADSLAGAYKYLKYVPTGVIRTAQAAEWKMQAWRLGKLPTITQHAVGSDRPTSPAMGSDSTALEDDFDKLSVRSTESGGKQRLTASNGKPIKQKGSKTFLSGLFGGESKRSPKSSADAFPSDSASLRPSIASSDNRRSSYYATPPSSLGHGQGLASPSVAPTSSFDDRRASSISTSSASLLTPQDFSLPSSPNVPNGMPTPTHSLSGQDLANGLLRASHAESLHGGTSDLMVILARTSNSAQAGALAYGEIKSQVKVWWGERDDRISMQSMRWLEQEVQKCEVKVVEGADHSLMTNGRVMIEVLESIAQEWK